MTIDHKIFGEQGIVITTLVGAVTDADILPGYMRLYEDENWKPGYHEIVDLRNAKMDGVTAEGLRSLSVMVEGYVAGKCDRFKSAVVAPKDLPFGLARLYEALSEESPESVKVFRNMKDALGWVGVDEAFAE